LSKPRPVSREEENS